MIEVGWRSAEFLGEDFIVDVGKEADRAFQLVCYGGGGVFGIRQEALGELDFRVGQASAEEAMANEGCAILHGLIKRGVVLIGILP